MIGYFNDTLFFIFNSSGSFTAEERADAISQRIKKLAKNSGFKKDSIQLVPNENYIDLVAKDRTVMSISDNDAIWENTSSELLAARYQAIINKEISNYHTETSFSTLLKEILLALFLIVLFIYLIKYITKFFRWTRVKIHQQRGRLLKGFKIKSYTVLDSSMEVKFFLNVNNVLKWLLIFLVIYLALPAIFGIFPWTKNFAATLFGYILNPLKSIASSFWNFVPNLITIIVIVFVFRYVFKALKYLKNEIKNEELSIPGFYPD